MSALTIVLTAILLVVGTLFVLLGAVGIVRMPDVYMRLQTTSKSITLGAACVLVAAAIYFAREGIMVRTLLIMFFLFATTPIAAHVLSRVSYLSGLALAPETRVDDLAGRYTQAGGLLSPGQRRGEEQTPPADADEAPR